MERRSCLGGSQTLNRVQHYSLSIKGLSYLLDLYTLEVEKV